MKEKIIFFAKYLLPVLFWAGLIFYFSSIPSLRYSQDNTEEVILRKGAHFLEFFVLAFLVFRIFFRGLGLSPLRSAVFSAVICSLYGASDEWHQTFVSGRSGRFFDTLYDSLSAIVSLSLVTFFKIPKKFLLKTSILVLSVSLLVFLELDMIREAGDTGSIRKTTESLSVLLKKVKRKLGYETRVVKEKVVEKVQDSPVVSSIAIDQEEKNGSSENIEIPPRKIIKVPFSSQAPLGVWDARHEEACEETSLIMLKYYLDKKELTPETAENEIQKMIDFEIENYGSYEDTSIEKNIQLFKDFYGEPGNGKRLEVVYDFKKEDLKKYLAAGEPVIVAAAGRELNNPYYTAPGPLYHNLVLVGYDGNTIISNDPGTKRGEGYKYNINTLYNAIHDFSGDLEKIDEGRKAMIILK